jgi:hypothetical protein
LRRRSPFRGIGPHVLLKLPAKAVLLHPDRDRAGHPEGIAQSGIAAFREMRGAAKLAGLLGAEIESAIFQKLPDVSEATQVSGFRQDDQRENRSDPRHGLQTIEIRVPSESVHDVRLKLLAPPAEVLVLLEDESKHANRFRVLRHG